jgi:hypothetical protein
MMTLFEQSSERCLSCETDSISRTFTTHCNLNSGEGLYEIAGAVNKAQPVTTGVVERLQKRDISEKVCQHYNISQEVDSTGYPMAPGL